MSLWPIEVEYYDLNTCNWLGLWQKNKHPLLRFKPWNFRSRAMCQQPFFKTNFNRTHVLLCLKDYWTHITLLLLFFWHTLLHHNGTSFLKLFLGSLSKMINRSPSDSSLCFLSHICVMNLKTISILLKEPLSNQFLCDG